MESQSTVVQPRSYQPNLTLGGSGYVPCAADQLSERVAELDALMTLLTTLSEDGAGLVLEKFNEQVRLHAMFLAARLAHDVHELHEQLFIEEVNARVAAQ